MASSLTAPNVVHNFQSSLEDLSEGYKPSILLLFLIFLVTSSWALPKKYPWVDRPKSNRFRWVLGLVLFVSPLLFLASVFSQKSLSSASLNWVQETRELAQSRELAQFRQLSSENKAEWRSLKEDFYKLEQQQKPKQTKIQQAERIAILINKKDFERPGERGNFIFREPR